MVRRCCIATCRNSRADCDEKVSLFRVPSERRLFDSWARAIDTTGSDILKTSAVCERHFREHEIKREALLRDSFGNVILKRPLEKFSLSKEAVPSIFNEDLEDSKKRRKRRTTPIDSVAKTTFQGVIPTTNTGIFNVNYSDLLVTFNQTNNSIVELSPPPNARIGGPIKNADQNNENHLRNSNGATDNSNYLVNGGGNMFCNEFEKTNHTESNQERSVDDPQQVTELTDPMVSIYIKLQDSTRSNNSGNNNLNIVSDSTGNKEILQNIPNQCHNANGSSIPSPKEVTIIIPEDEVTILNENRNISQKMNAPRKAHSKKNVGNGPFAESKQINMQAFDLIFHNSHKIRLPNPMWGYHKNSIDKDIIIFSKTKWFKSDVLIPPIYEKQVIFHESDDIRIYINNKFSPLEVRRPKDLQEMELILRYVDETVVCSGGPSIGECDTAQCAQKDYAVSRWRHKLCPIIVTQDESICKFCSTINQVLRYPKKKRLPFGRKPAARDCS